MNNIKKMCLKETSKNAIEIAIKLMKDENIPIHGPVHHFLDGAALMTALYNAGLVFDLSKALDELEARAEKMPGAMCGLWGVCGSSASIGACMSVILGTTPLSDTNYYKSQMHLTSRILDRIASIGGPRCCKRNGFIALSTAIEYLNSIYNLHLETSDFVCEFSELNKQCIHERCPFNKSAM